MIIGYDFFGKNLDGNIYDTPVSTTGMDEVTLGSGMYDELFVSVDTTIGDEQVKPTAWEIKTIMDAKFDNSIEAGTIDGSGKKVTSINLYRRVYKTSGDWQLVASFPYDEDYNVYTVIDRFVENGKTYEYCIAPIAQDVMGDLTKSQPVEITYDGVYVSDLNNNFKLEADFELGDVTYNKNSNIATPLNSPYPIVSFGKQDYRTGTVKFLPLTQQQLDGTATGIDAYNERLNRENVVEFLNNGRAKVLRRDNGDLMVCVTTGIKSTPKLTGTDSISDVSFDFTEIGKLDYSTMSKSGLIASAGKSIYTYDDFGDVLWNNEPINEEARRKYRNSFAE